jgi:glucose/arabinose dehydrogenase
MFDAKGKLFVVIGDLNRQERTTNFETSNDTNRIGAILRIQPNGNGIATNPFNAQQETARTRGPLADVYAYGIRNSFGIAFDAVTGNLWDTENGPDRMDEINLVRPGFNSGWRDIMGPMSQTPVEPGSLVQLGDNAHYSDPELSFSSPVAPTDLHFYEGSRLGSAYRNDLFVGDVNTGSLFHFDLTSQRKSLRLSGPLSDYIVNNEGDLIDELGDVILGEGFGTISDILSGPGGMFVLSLSDGTLFRIQQDPDAGARAKGLVFDGAGVVVVPEPSWTAGLLIVAWASRRRGRRLRGKCLGATPGPR